METKKSLAYLKAKRKVETLKGFYGHLAVYLVLNTILILFNSNVFSKGAIELDNWENYFTAIMWGIGLFFHFLYVLIYFNFNSNFIKNWEDRKIREFLEEQQDDL